MGSSRILLRRALYFAPVGCDQRERFRPYAQDGFIVQPEIVPRTSAISSGNGRDPSRRSTGQGNVASHA
jgi:hypothetical protein